VHIKNNRVEFVVPGTVLDETHNKTYKPMFQSNLYKPEPIATDVINEYNSEEEQRNSSGRLADYVVSSESEDRIHSV
jgi:hypothetical protein